MKRNITLEDKMNGTDSIVICGLKKSYRKDLPPAVDLQGEVHIHKGELFGIIGPDGAGKTTLFRMLATLVLPDGGSASLEGLDIVRDYRKIRTLLGYMPGRFSLYPDLSVRENLEFFASVFGKEVEANYGLISNIYDRLKPFERRKSGKLSGGMKQKLARCCSLIHSPSVLFLDEPTTGVDPSSRRELWENLADLKASGMTIVVSTAYMDEADRCDRVAMMKSGRFLTVDSPADIISKFDRRLFAARSEEMFRLLQDLKSIADVERCYTFGDTHHFILKRDSHAGAEDLAEQLRSACGHRSVEVNEVPASLEDCYMNLEEAGSADMDFAGNTSREDK